MDYKSASFLRRKKRNRQNKDSPFPVPIGTITGSQPIPSEWQYYTGYLQGQGVVVQHSGDINNLYKMGFFGKGLYSRGAPANQSSMPSVHIPVGTGTSDVVKVMRRRRYLTHCHWRKSRDQQSANQQREPEDLEYDSDGEFMETDEGDHKHDMSNSDKKSEDILQPSAGVEHDQGPVKQGNFQQYDLEQHQDENNKNITVQECYNQADQDNMDDSYVSDSDIMPLTLQNAGNSKLTEEDWDNMQADEDFWGCADVGNSKIDISQTKVSNLVRNSVADLDKADTDADQDRYNDGAANSVNVNNRTTLSVSAGNETVDSLKMVENIRTTDAAHSFDSSLGKCGHTGVIHGVSRDEKTSHKSDSRNDQCRSTSTVNRHNQTMRCMTALLLKLKQIDQKKASLNDEVMKCVEYLLAKTHLGLHEFYSENEESSDIVDVSGGEEKNQKVDALSEGIAVLDEASTSHSCKCSDSTVCDKELLNKLGFDNDYLKLIRLEILKYVIKCCQDISVTFNTGCMNVSPTLSVSATSESTLASLSTASSEAALKSQSAAKPGQGDDSGDHVVQSLSPLLHKGLRNSDASHQTLDRTSQKYEEQTPCTHGQPCTSWEEKTDIDKEILLNHFLNQFEKHNTQFIDKVNTKINLVDTSNKFREGTQKDIANDLRDGMNKDQVKDIDATQMKEILTEIDEGKFEGGEVMEERSDLINGISKDVNAAVKELVAHSGKPLHPYVETEDDDGEFLVIDDSDYDDYDNHYTSSLPYSWKPIRKKDVFPVTEPLMLSAEEAFFLSYGLGCLTVLDAQGMAVSLQGLWNLFCASPRFLPRYVAYHFIRSKGWVPRAGILFGTDFIVYKEGPPFLHSSYSVVVKAVDKDSLMEITQYKTRDLTWTTLAGLDRVTEHVSKKLMFCYVLMPKDLSVDINSPQCLSRCKVRLQLVNRWVSSQDRDKDAEEEVL